MSDQRFAFNCGYRAVAASQTDSVLGNGRGDLLERIVIQVTTSATSQVQIKDGAGGSNIIVVPNNHPVGAYTIEIGARCQSAGWRITTGAGVALVAVGHFN
jgi:hypothetical protein